MNGGSEVGFGENRGVIDFVRDATCFLLVVVDRIERRRTRCLRGRYGRRSLLVDRKLLMLRKWVGGRTGDSVL